jgi:hypothetical protein
MIFDEGRFQWHERTIINLKATIVWLATFVRAGSMLEMFGGLNMFQSLLQLLV